MPAPPEPAHANGAATPVAESSGRWWGVDRRQIVISAVMALLLLGVYFQVRLQYFTNFDDDHFVVNNHFVNKGFSIDGLVWDFGFQGLSQWHPLAWMSHQLDCQLFGLNAGAHKLHNLILHIGNTILLFQLLRVLTGRFWPAAAAAFFWSIHPLRVEAVAWVAERKELLCSFFSLWTLLAYHHYVRRPGVWRYLLVLALFCLALMGKPMAITLPCVMLLLDYWPLRRAALQGADLPRWKHLLLEKAPFLPPMFISALMTTLCQLAANTLRSFAFWPWPFRAANTFTGYAWYLRATFFPGHLMVLYPLQKDISLWTMSLSIATVVVITALAIRNARRLPYFLVGWFMFLGMLVPAIGLVQVGSQRYADRYTYFPSIGLFLIAFWGLSDLLKRIPVRPAALWTAASAAALVMLFVTWLQVGYWFNSLTLWSHAIVDDYTSRIAQLNLGQAYSGLRNYEEATKHYREALRFDPNTAEAWNNLGLMEIRKGRYDKAVEYLRTAIRVDPNAAATYSNIGVALLELGKTRNALNAFAYAVKLDPNYAVGYRNLAIALDGLNMTAESLPFFERASQMIVNDASVRTRYAAALLRMGKRGQGLEQLDRVLNDFPHAPLAMKIKEQVLLGLPIEAAPKLTDIYGQDRMREPSAPSAISSDDALVRPQR